MRRPCVGTGLTLSSQDHRGRHAVADRQNFRTDGPRAAFPKPSTQPTPALNLLPETNADRPAPCPPPTASRPRCRCEQCTPRCRSPRPARRPRPSSGWACWWRWWWVPGLDAAGCRIAVHAGRRRRGVGLAGPAERQGRARPRAVAEQREGAGLSDPDAVVQGLAFGADLAVHRDDPDPRPLQRDRRPDAGLAEPVHHRCRGGPDQRANVRSATDVDAVCLDWGLPTRRAVGRTTPQELAGHVGTQIVPALA